MPQVSKSFELFLKLILVLLLCDQAKKSKIVENKLFFVCVAVGPLQGQFRPKCSWKRPEVPYLVGMG